MVKFSQDIFDTICDRIVNGESLRSICEEEGMPSRRGVEKWLDSNPDLVRQYARAREIQADHFFEEARTIALAARPDNVAVAKLQWEDCRWRASKLRPKVYGDKLAIGGADDLPPIKSTLDTSKLSTAALRELQAAMNAAPDPDEV